MLEYSVTSSLCAIKAVNVCVKNTGINELVERLGEYEVLQSK